ncbi:MAG: bifunctional glutamate N-acetyltransferase/amino-acid acetyltransferase ArgJ [Magnetospiraceae bacterium]
MAAKSPLAPDQFPHLPPIRGVRLATVEAGIKYAGRADLLLGAFDPETTVAGVFTKSKCASAPVDWCRSHICGGKARGLLVNSGNANAFTGNKGFEAVERSVHSAAAVLNCAPEQVFASSTGVIGEALPDEKITAAMEQLAGKLHADRWAAAAQAIMTTDTYPKGATRTTKIGETTVTINGIAKGAGMIAPDMATMLVYLATDAALPASVLQYLLLPAVEKSFNCITVDSDTSTSDSLLIFATGKAQNEPVEAASDPKLKGFAAALADICRDLAHQVVRDGEGATKFVTITVTSAENDKAAKRIGLSIANSPLVKTAIAGEDANWGRIVMAVGKAGEAADRDRLSIDVGGHTVARKGLAVDGYDETPVAAHMKGQEIDILVDVGIGDGRATVWTCDLTHGYIDINADYRS